MLDSKKTAPTRRDFLSRLIAGWVAISILPTIYGIIQYLIPPIIYEKISQHIAKINLSEIPLITNGVKILKFNKKAVFLFQIEKNQVRAISAICTHLGCVVQYQPEQKQFKCNCHGSTFDLTGKNTGGPAPTPLQLYRAELTADNDIIVSD